MREGMNPNVILLTWVHGVLFCDPVLTNVSSRVPRDLAFDLQGSVCSVSLFNHTPLDH